jgi:hypothetical protein
MNTRKTPRFLWLWSFEWKGRGLAAAAGTLARFEYLLAAHPQKGDVMATCETCGNNYDKAFQVTMNGEAHTFDSFECAIHALAPACDHCGTRILGHGLEKAGNFFCCNHCAEGEGVKGLRDRM